MLCHTRVYGSIHDTTCHTSLPCLLPFFSLSCDLDMDELRSCDLDMDELRSCDLDKDELWSCDLDMDELGTGYSNVDVRRCTCRIPVKS